MPSWTFGRAERGVIGTLALIDALSALTRKPFLRNLNFFK